MKLAIWALITSQFVVWASAPNLAFAEPNEWKLEKIEEAIEVHTRTVPGSGIRAARSVGNIDGGIDEVHAVLTDSDGYHRWFPNCSESKLLERSENVLYRYSVATTPWPVKNRDVVWRSITQRDEKSGILSIELSAAPDKYPLQSGRVRVHQANGSWQLESMGPTKTRVTFTMHLEPGGSVPDWLIDRRVVDGPFRAILNLRREIVRRVARDLGISG